MAELISVIIPVFNGSKTIQRAIDSVLNQQQGLNPFNLEIIVVDDGSTDNIIETLLPYGKKIRLIGQPNQGTGAARDTGIRASSGGYIAFLDSDDMWLPHKIQTQLEIFRENPEVGLVAGGTEFINEDGQPVRISSMKRKGWLAKELLYGNFIVASTVIAKRSLIDQFEVLFRVDLPMEEDWEFWLRLSSKSEFLVQPDVLAKNFIISNSRSQYFRENLENKRKQYLEVIKGLSGDEYFGKYIRKNQRKLYANGYLIQAYMEYFNKLHYSARKSILRSLLIYPINRNIAKLLMMLLLPTDAYLHFTNFLKGVRLSMNRLTRIARIRSILFCGW
jgi:glycosyltransferase involved in cell wall biosynthesis